VGGSGVGQVDLGGVPRRVAVLAAAVALVASGCVPALTPTPTPTPRSAAASSPPGGWPPAPLAPAPTVAGDPTSGRNDYLATGCGGCHTIRGVVAATGVAGPNLTNVVLRPTLAGDAIPMTPENLARWLLDPSALKPDTPMPNVGLTEEQARDITAFLYSQPYNPGP
jgi:cytochrome c1